MSFLGRLVSGITAGLSNIATALYNNAVNIYQNIVGKPPEVKKEEVQSVTDNQLINQWFGEMKNKVRKTVLKKNEYLSIEVKFTDGSSRYLIVTNNNRSEVAKEIEDILEFWNDSDGEMTGSDTLVLAVNKIKEVQSVVYEIRKTESKLKKGGFYPYIHHIDNEYVINYLRTLGIYNQEFISDNKETKLNYTRCLVEAFRGQLSDDKFSKLNDMVKTDFFHKDKLHEVAKRLGTPIRLITLQKKSDKEDAYQRRSTIYNKSKVVIQEEMPFTDTNIPTICLISDHYFRYDKNTQITKFFLQHYNEIKPCTGAHKVNKIKDGQIGFCRVDANFMDSFELVRQIEKCDLVEDINIESIMSHPESSKLKEWYNPSDLNTDAHCLEFALKEPKKVEQFFVFDYETITDTPIHIPYMVSLYGNHKGEEVCETFRIEESKRTLGNRAEQITTNLFNFIFANLRIRTTHNDRITMFAHNLTYDIQFIINHPNFIDKQPLINNGRIVGMKATFKHRASLLHLSFKDSYRIMPKRAADLPSMLGIPDIQKEVIYYELYNSKTIDKLDSVPISYVKRIIKEYHDKAIDPVVSDKKQIDFWNNLETLNLIDKDLQTVALETYAKFYCEQDCRVVYQSLIKFNEIFKIINPAMPNVWDFFSLPSIAQYHFYIKGCYDDSVQMSGLLANYFNNFVVGGRCMLAKNEKQHKTGRIQDFDAVSLYPSAMKRCDGLLKGQPLKWTEDINLDDTDYYFIRIVVTAVGKHRRFPTLSVIDENGSREWTNDLVDKIVYVDKCGLEDAIKYHDIKYKILDGYFFNQGFNTNINTEIEHIFDQRIKAKKAGNNGLQEVLKLLMNSTYGKLIQKASDEKTTILRGHSKKTKYIDDRYLYVKNADSLGVDHKDETTEYLIYEYQSVVESKSAPHLGCQILSCSKRIMNEVMNLAEDNNIEIFYQDTDSMHIFESDVKPLADKFKEVYDRDLIGKTMGQFHCDFSSDKLKGEIHSTEFIAFGKKCYLDVLSDETGQTDHHIRMKGVPLFAILDCVKRESTTLPQLYKSHYEGKQHTYDLLANNACSFDKDKSFIHSTRTEFTRTI